MFEEIYLSKYEYNWVKVNLEILTSVNSSEREDFDF